MNTLTFLDANVWLALLWSQHMQSEQARKWFERSADEQFSFCRFMQMTVLRLVTTKETMVKDTKNISDAWNLWDKVWADNRIAFLPEPDGLEKEFGRYFSLFSCSPKVWADACLLAFPTVTGVELVTFDRALKSRGADILVL